MLSFLEILIILNLIYFSTTTNPSLLSYAGGIYLLLVGVTGLLQDSDIFIGFLLVINLGLLLVFFIFVLHFTVFLHQKSQINITLRQIITIY